MIESFSAHRINKEREKEYDELVRYYCNNITQIATWMLIISIMNSIRQRTFSSRDALHILKILCTEFGVRSSGIEYFRAFAPAPSGQKASGAANVLRFTLNTDVHKTNNERLIDELNSSIRNKSLEYRQALELVIKILEYYPQAEKHL